MNTDEIKGDPIIEELRRAKERYAARFNYDLEAMVKDAREKTKASGHRVVSFEKKRATG